VSPLLASGLDMPALDGAGSSLATSTVSSRVGASRGAKPRSGGGSSSLSSGGGIELLTDLRPASGDLYALGSDRVVYRLNPRTAIAVPEGKSFDLMPSILSGSVNGFDFNPTVDKIRVTGLAAVQDQ
jgi:hypothetical protein